MIGLVVVSHSHELARSAVALAEQMLGDGPRPSLIAAGGLDETTFGTDATAIADALVAADDGDGVLVLLDLGSAVLAAEMALEFCDPDLAARVRISPAPLVEGLVAATVAAAAGRDLARCDAEARRGLAAKTGHLGGDPDSATDSATEAIDSASGEPVTGSATFTALIDLPDGLHARPAAAFVAALAGLDVEVAARNPDRGTGPADGGSAIDLLTLGLRRGDTVTADLTGPDAQAAVAALNSLAARRFGEK